MHKYINELKKVTFPSQKEVYSYFWIVLIGIIALVLYLFVVDSAILEVLNKLYK